MGWHVEAEVRPGAGPPRCCCSPHWAAPSLPSDFAPLGLCCLPNAQNWLTYFIISPHQCHLPDATLCKCSGLEFLLRCFMLQLEPPCYELTGELVQLASNVFLPKRQGNAALADAVLRSYLKALLASKLSSGLFLCYIGGCYLVQSN